MKNGKLQGRVAVVTGAAQGLGAEIAELLGQQGFQLALIDINEDGLARVQHKIRQDSGTQDVFTLRCDLSNVDEVSQGFLDIRDRYGRIDVLVNVAGGSGYEKAVPIEELPYAVWQKVMDNNITSTFLCCQAVVPHMLENKYGRIVNFSSGIANGLAGQAGPVGSRLPYAASKAAINGFTKQLSKDLGHAGITVNAVAPGLILPSTGRITDSFQTLSAEEKQKTLSHIPLGRTGIGREVATAVGYLVSEDAGFTSGAILNVDGAAF